VICLVFSEYAQCTILYIYGTYVYFVEQVTIKHYNLYFVTCKLFIHNSVKESNFYLLYTCPIEVRVYCLASGKYDSSTLHTVYCMCSDFCRECMFKGF
jgi:hypothetical protein